MGVMVYFDSCSSNWYSIKNTIYEDDKIIISSKTTRQPPMPCVQCSVLAYAYFCCYETYLLYFILVSYLLYEE